jgi:hypothetical protein
MKNDFAKIIFHPQTPLVLNAKKLLLNGIRQRTIFFFALTLISSIKKGVKQIALTPD